MAVVTVSTLTIKPDRMEDYVEVARGFKASLEKGGATNVRLLAAVVAQARPPGRWHSSVSSMTSPLAAAMRTRPFLIP